MYLKPLIFSDWEKFATSPADFSKQGPVLLRPPQAAEQVEICNRGARRLAKRQASNPREHSSNGTKVRLADGYVDTGFDSGHRRLRDGFHPLDIGLPHRGLRVRE